MWNGGFVVKGVKLVSRTTAGHNKSSPDLVHRQLIDDLIKTTQTFLAGEIRSALNQPVQSLERCEVTLSDSESPRTAGCSGGCLVHSGQDQVSEPDLVGCNILSVEQDDSSVGV